MLQQELSRKQLRDLYAPKTRTLEEAAEAAHLIAMAEHLPVSGAPGSSTEAWHRETMLKMIPVYGRRGVNDEQIPAGARLEGDRAVRDTGAWTGLKVKGADYKRYLEWLRSVW